MMNKSKLLKWIKRGAITMIACAAVFAVSAEQANAQFYNSRGFSNGNFGRTGISLNIGTGGVGFGNYGRSNFNGFNSGFNNSRYVPQRSFYRGNSFYGNGGFGNGRGNGNFKNLYRRF